MLCTASPIREHQRGRNVTAEAVRARNISSTLEIEGAGLRISSWRRRFRNASADVQTIDGPKRQHRGAFLQILNSNRPNHRDRRMCPEPLCQLKISVAVDCTSGFAPNTTREPGSEVVGALLR